MSYQLSDWDLLSDREKKVLVLLKEPTTFQTLQELLLDWGNNTLRRTLSSLREKNLVELLPLKQGKQLQYVRRSSTGSTGLNTPTVLINKQYVRYGSNLLSPLTLIEALMKPSASIRLVPDGIISLFCRTWLESYYASLGSSPRTFLPVGEEEITAQLSHFINKTLEFVNFLREIQDLYVDKKFNFDIISPMDEDYIETAMRLESYLMAQKAKLIETQLRERENK